MPLLAWMSSLLFTRNGSMSLRSWSTSTAVRPLDRVHLDHPALQRGELCSTGHAEGHARGDLAGHGVVEDHRLQRAWGTGLELDELVQDRGLAGEPVAPPVQVGDQRLEGAVVRDEDGEVGGRIVERRGEPRGVHSGGQDVEVVPVAIGATALRLEDVSEGWAGRGRRSGRGQKGRVPRAATATVDASRVRMRMAGFLRKRLGWSLPLRVERTVRMQEHRISVLRGEGDPRRCVWMAGS